MTDTSRRPLLAAIAIGLVLVIAGQVAAGALAPAQQGSVAEAAGRAGFAYLTGIRTFAAAVIWNRLDPIFHEYYQELPLAEQLNLMPMVRMVNWLDPGFVDGYYVSAWILSQRGDLEQAYAVAADGVEANPESGILRMSYAQILYLNGETEEALVQAERAFEATEWKDDVEKHDSFTVLASIFKVAGDPVMQARVEEELVRLDAALGDRLAPEDHDHDGDGVPDH
jgi:tetratricopeptide (TPR) repeat protein